MSVFSTVIYYELHYINWLQNHNKCSLLILPSLCLENALKQLSIAQNSIPLLLMGKAKQETPWLCREVIPHWFSNILLQSFWPRCVISLLFSTRPLTPLSSISNNLCPIQIVQRYKLRYKLFRDKKTCLYPLEDILCIGMLKISVKSTFLNRLL